MSTIVINGANRGIGLGLCKYYQARGDEVVALCRKSSHELNALGVRVVEGIDVTDKFLSEVLEEKLSDLGNIDVLINVAGIMHNDNINNINFDHLLEQYEVNAMGPIRMTFALLAKMTQGSKIIMVTSRMGSIEDNGTGSRYGYRMSKAALNAGAKGLAVDLRDRGIAVAILHPGRVQTDMTNHNPKGITVDESCEGLLQRIDNLNDGNSGTFWHANGEILPW
jgi:NAD(P)-dependent dehydrogenase (short-subunit alcohol dehydrogenase family)